MKRHSPHLSRLLHHCLQVGALLLLAACAQGTGVGTGTATDNGATAVLPAPPDKITAFDGEAHWAALHEPKFLAAHDLDTQRNDQAAAAAYKVASDAGNPIAQYVLGTRYMIGEGVPRDPVAAVRQFHLGAVAGYAPAQTYLGDAYEKGLGVARDQAMANRWYAFAAAQGEDTASTRLAYAKISGDGMPRDVAGALQILHRCMQSKPGVDVYNPNGGWTGPGCEALLGAMYFEGQGVPVDQATGILHLTRAANAHVLPAEKALAKAYDAGIGVAKDSDKAAHWRQAAEDDADIGPGFWMQL
jgi:hypothetical protein